MNPAVFNLASLNGKNGFNIIGYTQNTGCSVNSAGDINGDGVDDIIVGAWDAAGSDYVIFGKTSAFSAHTHLSRLDGKNGFAFYGPAPTYAACNPTDKLGDINGDGIDDIIIGNYVVFGNRAGFSASMSFNSLDGQNGFAFEYGRGNAKSVGSAGYGNSRGVGDVNGDGINDLFIGCSVVFGRKTGFNASFDLNSLNGNNGFTITSSNFGCYSVGRAGDINGDGIDDIVIGSPHTFASGRSCVVFGSKIAFSASFHLSSLDGTNGFMIDGYIPNSKTGYSVNGGGDVNGDGINDIIIGTFYCPGLNYVVFGRKTGFDSVFQLSSLDGHNGFLLNGSSDTNVGHSVSIGGDVNGDGIGDILIGTDPDHSYVVFGKKTGFDYSIDMDSLNGQNGFILSVKGIKKVSIGFSPVSILGDVNGDGIDDMIVGDSDAFNLLGAAYVVFGNRSFFPSTPSPSSHSASESNHSSSNALEIGLGVGGGVLGLALLGVVGYCAHKHYHPEQNDYEAVQ